MMEKEEASSKEAIKSSSTSEAIAALRRGNLNASSLSGELGSFRTAGDHRFNSLTEVSDFKNKLNISKSFQGDSLEYCCKRGTKGRGRENGFHLVRSEFSSGSAL